MWRHRNYNIFCAILLLGLTFAQQLSGQNSQVFPKDNSPYSRFGLGNLVDQYFISASGMGGISAAYNDPFHINVVNPASIASLQNTAFEVGLFMQNTNLKASDDNTDNVWTGNLSYLALGFPLKNPINKALDKDDSPWRFGMAFSLLPYSLVGYNVENEFANEEVGDITNSLKGSGGNYRLLWSNAAAYKDLSIGFTLGYQFGKITDSRKIDFEDLSSAYNIDTNDDISVGGLVWNIGAQYEFNLDRPKDQIASGRFDRRVIIGAYGKGNTSFNTETTSLVLGENFGYGSIDTIASSDNLELSGTLPAEYGFGVIYQKTNNYRLGADFRSTLWSNYRNEAKPEVFSNTWTLHFGGEYIPDIMDISNYFTKVRYRFGTFFGKDYRSINGEQLNVWGITAGAGFPVVLSRQRLSYVNLSLSYSRLGIDSGLKERYFKINFGFTLNDNSWFFKRKFD